MNEPDDDATLDEVIGGIDVPAYVEEYIDQYRAICQRDPDRGGGYKAVGKARDALRDAIRRAIYDAEQAERSALAHAARGEAVRSWRDVEGTLPARRDGDKVARVDEVVPAFLDPTPPPATGEAERCEDHGREGCIDCESATGEAGTRGEVEKAALPTRGDVGRPELTRDPVFLLRWRPKKVDPGRDRWHVEGVWFTREEAEQFAKAHAYRWGSDQFGPCWHVYCVPADGEMARLLKAVTIRALPEAREGRRPAP